MEPNPLAIAMEWVARITTVALMMVLPGLGGWWLDSRFGTTWLVAVGFGIGLVMGVAYLLRLVRPDGRPHGPPQSKSDESPDE